jgi:hypothetical protein
MEIIIKKFSVFSVQFSGKKPSVARISSGAGADVESWDLKVEH